MENVERILSDHDIPHGCVLNAPAFVKIYCEKKIDALRVQNLLSKTFKNCVINIYEENLNKKDSVFYEERFGEIIRYIVQMNKRG